MYLCAQFINEDDREQKLFTEIRHAFWHIYGSLLDIEIHTTSIDVCYTFFQLLYVILTLAVPIIGYYYVKIYRDKVCGGAIQFSHAVLFTIFMYMFASLLVAVAHYIYFQFIDHGFIFNTLADFWNQAIEQSPALQENKELMKDMFDADKINSLSAIDITMQMLSSDVFFGSILAIPTGLMVMKKAKPGNNEPS